MLVKIISEMTESKVNYRLSELGKTYHVAITHLSTCPAPEKYARYDVMVTVAVTLTEKLEAFKS